MFPRFLALGLLSLTVFGVSGCSRTRPAPVNGLKQIGLGFQSPSDDLGRPINLTAPAKRVIVIGPGAVETMFVLGAQSQLVGRDDYANYPEAAKKVAIGGNFNGPNVEQCLALRPDLIVVQGETSNNARFNDWQTKIGVPVAALTTTNFKSLAADFRKLGAWIGKSTEAETLAKKFDIALPKAPLTALVQTGDSAGWIAGKGTLVSDTVRHAGFTNIADKLKIEGYKQVNFESLLVTPPDVVIVPSSKPKAQVLAALRANAALAKLPCIRKGRILVANGDWLLRPGPRLLLGVEELKKQSGA
ncbi:ABC transporter substrate-binding protein [bacterium]|nr:MAG: ABC transporter substrate-binding protein [bacterium]